MSQLFLAAFLPSPLPVVAHGPSTTQSTISSPPYHHRQRHTSMPRYLSLRSKSQRVVVDDTHSIIEDSGSTSSDLSRASKKSKLKEMSTKAAKGVKRQLLRLDDFLHHVTHTKHESTDDEENDIRRRRTVSVPSPVLPSTVPSFRVIRSRSAWYLKQTSTESQDSLSHPRCASVEVGIQTDEAMPDLGTHSKEGARAQEEPELSSSEERLPHVDPTTVYVEAAVPDPFLLDEEGDALSEQDKEGGSSSAALSPTHIPLDISSSQQLPTVTSPTLNVNKDVPPPPGSEEGDEEELPDLYLPSLILPAMFLPIPNTDPLTTLLNKYIYPPERRPQRDSTGEWTHSDYHSLVMTNSWRALAKMARDQLVAADPSDLNLILSLWHLRLSCLARLRLFNQTSAECTNLFSVLASIEPPETRTYIFDRVLPFELEVMYTRLKYWTGDNMGYLDALAALLKKCRLKCRAATSVRDESVIPMWKERGARVALIMASQMVEMKELSAAIKLLEPLASQPEASPPLLSSIARIYLQAGNIPTAKELFAKIEADQTVDEQMKKMNTALLATTEGDYVAAVENFRAILEKDSDHYVALNNLAVALLNQARAKEAIEVLENALQASPSTVVVAEPFLFNLATLYELRATAGLEKKKELLITVAKWSGDGLKTSCLKMPAN